MTLIRTTLAAVALSLAYAGPVLAADAMSKEKGRTGGPTGWEGPAVVPGSVAADSLSKEEYKAKKERMAAAAKAAHEKCKGMSGNARNACIAEAKANEKAAKDELEARRKASAKARLDLRVANAMDYENSKKKCNERSGKDRTACLKDAGAAHEQARNQAKAAR